MFKRPVYQADAVARPNILKEILELLRGQGEECSWWIFALEGLASYFTYLLLLVDGDT